MGEKPKIPESGPIESVELKHALEERYLAYALSTIMHRALPDVRDGMKPVHRRLLYAMRLLKLEPQLPPKKSKFTEAQIAFILRQADEGTPVPEVCRKAGISDAT
jgi:DNA gyrase/topoisomerase IV subunit A